MIVQDSETEMCKLGISGGIRVTLKGEEPEGRHSCYWLPSVLRWPTARPMDKQATALLEAGSLWGGSGNEDRSATPAVALPVCSPHWVCALRGTLSGALLSWTQASLDAPSLALSPLVSVVVAPTACALEAPAIGSTHGDLPDPLMSHDSWTPGLSSGLLRSLEQSYNYPLPSSALATFLES